MAVVFDPETLARFRTMQPLEVYREAKNSVYRAGAVSSDDFLEIFQELVNQGVLSWDQVEDFEG